MGWRDHSSSAQITAMQLHFSSKSNFLYKVPTGRSFWQKRQFLLSLFLHCAFLMQDFPLIYIIKKDCRVPRIWCLRLRSGTPPLLAKTNPNKTTPIFAATERAFPAISSLMFLYLHFPFKQIFFFSCQAGRNMEGGWISHESLKQKKGGNKTQPERKQRR